MGTTRSDAERDAITVEIGFAVVTGMLAAGLVFGVVAGAAWYFGLPEVFIRVGAVAGALAFVARAVQVLWRFPRRRSSREPDMPGQPSQPGLTSPDS
ncbi:hypothetical protein KQY30_32405 [Streptomyces sp. GMY02]|uniref:DUF6332 family protein n=1 Tax=Streptomyces sp. GMY02 TaxID=1333528 RepID=UPI001C2C7E32|nr:DUF6332 family protein [Streptomyces sp. GMY02]QXE38238.1 hypothetical protein KQY30_32405 [Streptomyces sp. GMY02]